MKIEVVSALPHSTVHSAVLSRRNKSIICAGPYEILPLDTCFEQLPSTSSLSECPIECLGISTDERSIGVATNALLKIADIETGREIRNLTGHTLPITSVAPSKFSVYSWYTGSSDCSWAQWDTRMHPSKVLGARTTGVVRSVALSPGDRFIAIGTDHSIQLFDARQRQYVKQFNCSGHRLEFNPTECLLSSVGHDRIVRFFCMESLDMISQSDPFLDDIQASAFDTHLMITATNDSINLLTWEPCDILTTVPLKNVEKVVNVSVNNGVELDFICIGQNTERLEMRSYSIEELLSYSPSHELCGSIYEEDEEEDLPDVSPTEESNPIVLPESPVVSSSDASSNKSSSPIQSSASSPTRTLPPKQRTTSQKMTNKFRLDSKLPVSSVSSTKPPIVKAASIAQQRSSSTSSKSPSVRPKPSPSMSDLRATRTSSLAGSTQSLLSERATSKTRSVSNQRNTDAITITYMGRPRTPSEGESRTSRKITSPPIPTPVTRRKPSPSLSREPSKKSVGKKSENSFSSWSLLIPSNTTSLVHDANTDIKQMKGTVTKRGSSAFILDDVTNNDRLLMVAIRILNRKDSWALNTCHMYIPILIDNILSSDDEIRSCSLAGLDNISNTMLERLVKFANSNSRIGVDVAAEERAEKAQSCLNHLRDLCKKRDWYYKQLDETSVLQLDSILQQLKIL